MLLAVARFYEHGMCFAHVVARGLDKSKNFYEIVDMKRPAEKKLWSLDVLSVVWLVRHTFKK